MTYSADFYCSKCGAQISYQKHKRSKLCDKCLDRRNHRITRTYKSSLPAGFYTLVTAAGIWLGGRVYDAYEMRNVLSDDALPIGGLVAYWEPHLRETTILYSVVQHGATSLALVKERME